MAVAVPKRIASGIINALKGGVVPRTGLGYIAVGRTAEINALLHDVDITEEGGAFFRFIVGRYGSGKFPPGPTATTSAMEGFSCAEAVRIIPLLVVSSASTIFITTRSAKGLIVIYISSLK